GAWGRGGRSGGFAPGGGATPDDAACRELGAGPARHYWELTEQALARLATLACDAFVQTGSLRLAADEGEREALRAEYDALVADGFAAEWVDELPAPLDGLFHGAVVHPSDGSLRPARWVRRLAALAADAGAEWGAHERAESLEALRGAQVLSAAGGYTGGLIPSLDERVRPTRGQVLVTEPLVTMLYPRPHYARYGFDYWQQLPDGRLVIGGQRDASLDTEWTAGEETTPAIQE